MPRVRVFYDKAGKVLEIEHRVDGNYTPENITRADLAGVESVVLDSAKFEDIPFEQLQVRNGAIRRRQRSGGRAAAAQDRGRRIAEIREMDKSQLSDGDWLKLFREYMTLTEGF